MKAEAMPSSTVSRVAYLPFARTPVDTAANLKKRGLTCLVPDSIIAYVSEKDIILIPL